MGKLRRLVTMPFADKAVLARAWLALLAVDVGVRLFSLQAVQRFIETRGKQGGSISPARLLHFVRLAARHHLWQMACLPQALALCWLLSREGIVSDVRIGVRRQAGALEAHAWVELEGRPLGEPADVRERFQVMQASA